MEGHNEREEGRVLDVIIVGAGVAGLTAAHRLRQAHSDISLLVLEAKDRVGGRTLTVPVDVGDGRSEKFDLGGQWVGDSQLHICRLLQELGLSTYPQYTEGLKVMQLGGDKVRTYRSNIPPLGSFWALLELQWFIWKTEKLASRTPMIDPYSSPHAALLDGETVDSFTRKNMSSEAGRESINVAMRTVFGTDASRISALYFLAYANAAGGVLKLLEAKRDDAQGSRIKGGVQQVSELLAEKIGQNNILLSHPVIHVRQFKEHVIITTENGKRFTTRHAIFAAPPNMLIKMTFDPPLPPAKQQAYENHPMGHLTKFLVTYKKAFWRDNGYSGEVVSGGGTTQTEGVSSGPLSICFDATSHSGNPAIVGFIAGRQGVEWHAKTSKEREEAVVAGLKATLGTQAQDYVAYIEKVWSDEPYTGGCPVAYGVPGVMYTFSSMRLPFNRIHFAGTECATEWVGYISGAVQSGERAATEILHILHPGLVPKEKLLGTCFDPKSLPKDFKNIKHDKAFFRISRLLYGAVGVAVVAYIFTQYIPAISGLLQFN